MYIPEETTTSAAGSNSNKQIPLKRRLVYISIIYLSFIFLLVAVEIAIRLALPHVSSLDLFVATPQQKEQVANAKQATIFEGDPLLLWRLKPNLDHVVWDFTVLSTNSQGFRADYSIGAKQTGTFRIICVGDSVTFGYRVPVVWPEKPTEYDPSWLPYPMLLEKALREANPERKIEVIAMALPGYTSHQGLAWLDRDIDTLKPDLLIVSFGWNDVSLSDAADRETIRTNWYAVAVRWSIDHSQALAHATKWLRSRSFQRLAEARPVARVPEQEFLNNMLAIVRLGKEHGAGSIVIAAPYRDSVTNPREAASMSRYRIALRSFAGQNRIPFLEITELTEAAHPANAGWFGELIHPNHMGHRLIAAELLKCLTRNPRCAALRFPCSRLDKQFAGWLSAQLSRNHLKPKACALA
jgi:lysophospholipase L1-like esterase